MSDVVVTTPMIDASMSLFCGHGKQLRLDEAFGGCHLCAAEWIEATIVRWGGTSLTAFNVAGTLATWIEHPTGEIGT